MPYFFHLPCLARLSTCMLSKNSVKLLGSPWVLVAQWIERLPGVRKVMGSNPIGTQIFPRSHARVTVIFIYHFFCWVQLDPSIYESLQKEKVEVGDVIYIEANSGAVKVWSMFLDTYSIHWNWFHLQDFTMLCHVQHGTKYTISTLLAVIHLPTFVGVPCLRLINFQKDAQII